jgi:GWxTD domain-containing protein
MLLLVTCFWTPAASAQNAAPEFDVDVINVRGGGNASLTQVDIYTRIPYASLQFINSVNGFSARYTVTYEAHELDDRGRRRNLLQTRIWEGREQGIESYATTQSPDIYSFTTHSAELPPGRYVLEFQVEDRNTNAAFVREVITEVRDLNKPLAVSDPMFGDAYDRANNTIVPSVSNQVDTDALQLRLFYEIYSDKPRDVTVTREIVRVAADFDDLAQAEADADPVYSDQEVFSLKGKKNQHIEQIPIKDLGFGAYALRLKVRDAASGTLVDSAEKVFLARWSGLAAHISNVEEAISQLVAVAKDKDVRFIREGGTESERMNRFLDYWKKRDPTPNTRRNERMEQFYYLVAFANERYGREINGHNNGWQTDRGNVLINFGEPDHIKREPFSFNKEPYEIWRYERFGLQFIFIDKTGLGDYELLYNIWDERNRIR